MEVSDFYDKYTDQQFKKGIHVRHRTILKKLKKSGLQPNSNVLEIGCGIGTVTHLLGKAVPNGKIVAVDISPKSIELAKKFNKNFSNIEFLVSDMSAFSHSLKFDFILLPDVLEHIPIEHHAQLFKTIAKHMHPKSVIAIHIPHPNYLSWVHQHEPEKLQIIDQPIFTNELLPKVYDAGLYLHSLESYSLFTQVEDYQWIIIKPQQLPEHGEVKSKINLKLQDIASKLF